VKKIVTSITFGAHSSADFRSVLIIEMQTGRQAGRRVVISPNRGLVYRVRFFECKSKDGLP